MLSEKKKTTLIRAPRVPLSFLLGKHDREVNRDGMRGFSDSAIFYRLWELCNTLREPDAIEVLGEDRHQLSEAFLNRMDAMPWQTVPEFPHIRELADDDLTPLMKDGEKLYNALATVDAALDCNTKANWASIFRRALARLIR